MPLWNQTPLPTADWTPQELPGHGFVIDEAGEIVTDELGNPLGWGVWWTGEVLPEATWALQPKTFTGLWLMDDATVLMDDDVEMDGGRS